MRYIRLMTYNWQQNDWPKFRYDLSELEPVLNMISIKMGHVSGVVKALPANIRSDAMIDLMVTEAIKTSEIEGEYMSRGDVKSSIRNHLGMNEKAVFVRDKRAQGIAQLMLAVRDDYALPLTQDMFFSWHNMLMQGSTHINIGQWRSHTEPMQIVSGVSYKPKIHFEAPPSVAVPQEMARFINWFNQSTAMHPVIRSAIAHLYFETVHPFEDGNGRIGRALSEKALSQGLGRAVLISLSKTIEANKKAYYEALENAQKSNEITAWLTYFVHMVLDAQNEAEALIDFVLSKTRFLEHYEPQLDEAHRKVIHRMLREGVKGFSGGMSAQKYSTIAGVSKATATRHLAHLTDIGALIQTGSGRSTRYHLNLQVKG